MQKLETEEQCRRLARAICSDISLYQEKYLQQAKSGLPVPKELEDAIEEGRTLFISRAAPAFAHLYDTALLDILGIAPNTVTPSPAPFAPSVAPAPAPSTATPAQSPAASPAPTPNLPAPTAAASPLVTAPVSNSPASVAVDPLQSLSERRPIYEETGTFSKSAAIVILAAIIASAIYFFVFR